MDVLSIMLLQAWWKGALLRLGLVSVILSVVVLGWG